MKKIILLITIILLVGCSQTPETKETPEKTTPPVIKEQPTEVETTTSKEITPTEKPLNLNENELNYEVTVLGKEFNFEPKELNFKNGQKITLKFKNAGEKMHDFRIEELNIGTKMINPGETDTLEFTAKTGAYTSFCSIGNHRAQGMEGSIIVE